MTGERFLNKHPHNRGKSPQFPHSPFHICTHPESIHVLLVLVPLCPPGGAVSQFTGMVGAGIHAHCAQVGIGKRGKKAMKEHKRQL